MDEHLKAASAEDQAQAEYEQYMKDVEFLGAPAPAPAPLVPVAPAPAPSKLTLANIIPAAAAIAGGYFGFKKLKVKNKWIGAALGFVGAGGAAKIAMGPERAKGAVLIASAGAAYYAGKKIKKHPSLATIGTLVAAPFVGSYIVKKVG